MSFCKSLSAILLLSVAYVPANCDPHALGIQSRSIPDTSLTASSEWDALRGPERARLNSQADGPFRGSWVARVGDDKQWIQVDLLDIYHITSVATQGRTDYAQWVTSYKVACSTDGIVFNTVRVNYSGYCTSEKIFTGNSNQNSVVKNDLPDPQYCRYVRLMPLTFRGRVSLRFEVYGEGPIASQC